jgi:hypothetical protein
MANTASNSKPETGAARRQQLIVAVLADFNRLSAES